MARILAARSQSEPVVLVVEDLHWVDGASEVFVVDLAEAVRGTRTLLLVNFRPEYDSAWLDAPHCRVIALAPLGADAATELLRDQGESVARIGRIESASGPASVRVELPPGWPG